MSKSIDIGAWEDFPDRELTKIDVRGMEIGVCRWGDHIYAFRNRCPHEGAPLCAGFLQQKLDAQMTTTGASLATDEAEPVILCPWHRWEFQLSDGSAAAPGFRMKTFRVEREGGRVLLRMGRN